MTAYAWGVSYLYAYWQSKNNGTINLIDTCTSIWANPWQVEIGGWFPVWCYILFFDRVALNTWEALLDEYNVFTLPVVKKKKKNANLICQTRFQTSLAAGQWPWTPTFAGDKNGTFKPQILCRQTFTIQYSINRNDLVAKISDKAFFSSTDTLAKFLTENL